MINKNYVGSTFDDFLEEQETLAESSVVAIKRVIAYQIEQTMIQNSLSKSELAKRMKTSRSSVDRLLDPHNTSISLVTMEKAAQALGKKLEVQLA